MWLVTQHGFYNVIQYPEDKERDWLTFKARRREDLEFLEKEFDGISNPIEESVDADYRFRLKVPRQTAEFIVEYFVQAIDYPMFKERIYDVQPDRHAAYLTVWATLLGLQEDY